jgi:Rrf2 family protein
VHVSAKADYALRALLEIAAHHPAPVSMSEVVERQALPRSFAVAILPELRRADFVRMRREHGVGYSLARPPREIRVGEVLRAVDGPFVLVRGVPPAEVTYRGPAVALTRLWREADDRLDHLLEHVTLADLLSARGDSSGDSYWTAAR